jgi:hypothetical protein
MRVALAVAAAALLAAPAQAPASTTPPARMKAIVRAWSARLNAGDNAGVAKLFALPAQIVQGPYVYRLTKRSQVALWHSALPCSGHIVSISIKGRDATAVFRLGNRKTSKCDAPGELAAARFTIVGGKIVMWVQVPVPEPKTSTQPVA